MEETTQTTFNGKGKQFLFCLEILVHVPSLLQELIKLAFLHSSCLCQCLTPLLVGCEQSI